jgi:hypothetical protein
LLPVKTRPPTMVGWPKAVVPLGNPKAHFNASLPALSAPIPPAAAGWKRLFQSSTPHPFHCDPATGFAPAAQCPLISGRTTGPLFPR